MDQLTTAEADGRGSAAHANEDSLTDAAAHRQASSGQPDAEAVYAGSPQPVSRPDAHVPAEAPSFQTTGLGADDSQRTASQLTHALMDAASLRVRLQQHCQVAA